MATSTSTAAANQEVQELKELFSRQPSTKALSLGYHPNVTCDRSMQCPIVGMRYKQKGRNYDLCEEEFGRLTPQEKSLFEQIMPPVYADDEEHIKRIVAENAPTNETLVDALVKQDRLKTQSYIQAFRSCDRGYFLPAGLAAHSIYADRPLKLPEPSEVHQSAPHMYATVIELMQFKPGHSFLNIGSGTGYLSALSGCFTGAEGINHGIEISASNVSLAKDSVRRFFADRQTFVPVKFCCANAFRLDVYRNIRYDRIYVGAACQQRGYEYLREAIKVGGFMVVPGEDGEFKDKLVRIKRIDELTFETESLMGVRFAPMQACPTELPDASEKEMLVIEHREDAADRMNRDVISATPTADPDDVKTPTSNLLIDVSAPVQEENRPDAGLGGSGKALTLTAKLGGSMKSLGRGLKKVKSKSKHELEEVHRRTEAAGNVVVAHGQKQSSQSDDALPHDVMISLNVRTMGDLGMRLKRFLAQRGIGAWVCVDNLGAGAGFRREILRAIQNCKCFLALINNEWAESAECEIESNLALNLNLHSHEQGRSVRGQPRVPFLLPVSFPGLDWSQETVQWFAVGTNFLSFDGDDESALFDRIHDSIVSCGLGIGSSVAPVRRTPQSSALSKTKLSAPIAQLQESSFYFVSSDKLKESSEQVLPSMQELRQREGWLVRMEFDPLEACQGAYNEEYLCVSHRWEEKDQPDSQGIQTQAIKDYLRRNPQIKYVWFDFWCCPQGERSDADKALFVSTLARVNKLYLACSVLIILDLSYLSRFWTCFEAFLSFQHPSAEGLKPATVEQRRCEIVCVHNAPLTLREMLLDLWANKSTGEAHEVLGKPDITVTNQSDKNTQMAKLLTLNDQIKDDFKELERRAAHGDLPTKSEISSPKRKVTPKGKLSGSGGLSSSLKTPALSEQPMVEWTCDDVVSFVRSMRLPEKVCDAFEENAVDGEMLLSISEKDDQILKDELGMKALQIEKMRREISRLSKLAV